MMKNKGFTLVEVMIVVGVAILLTTMTALSFSRLNRSQALGKSAELVVSVLNQARSETLSSKGAREYGVHFENNLLVIFEGVTYLPQSGTNRVVNLSDMVAISQVSLTPTSNDLFFSRLTGEASNVGSVTVSLRSDPSQFRVINISETGLIEEDI